MLSKEVLLWKIVAQLPCCWHLPTLKEVKKMEAVTLTLEKQNTCTFWRAELPLKDALNQPGQQKSIIFAIPIRTLILVGILPFKPMSAFANTQIKSTPLAIEPSEDGRFRLFWAEQYVGGLWSAAEIAQVELAAPQSFDQLILVLDCIAASSATLERLPP